MSARRNGAAGQTHRGGGDGIMKPSHDANYARELMAAENDRLRALNAELLNSLKVASIHINAAIINAERHEHNKMDNRSRDPLTGSLL